MNIIEIFKAGGPVMFPLLFISIANFGLFLHLITSFFFILRDLKRANQSPSTSFVEKVVKVRSEPDDFEDNWHKTIEPLLFHYERKSLWMSHLASLATLLGLLGTVIGIYIAFQNMKASGQASIEVFADGIGQALITTIYGLVIAIPSNFLYYILKHVLDGIEVESYNRNFS